MKFYGRDIKTLDDFFDTIAIVFEGHEPNIPTPYSFFIALRDEFRNLELEGSRGIHIEPIDPTSEDGDLGDVWLTTSSGDMLKKVLVEDVETWVLQVTLVTTGNMLSYSQHTQFTPEVVFCTQGYYEALDQSIKDDQSIVFWFVNQTS